MSVERAFQGNHFGEYCLLKNLNQILKLYIDLHEIKVNCEYVSRMTDVGFAFA